jgi:hypothetical protein
MEILTAFVAALTGILGFVGKMLMDADKQREQRYDDLHKKHINLIDIQAGQLRDLTEEQRKSRNALNRVEQEVLEVRSQLGLLRGSLTPCGECDALKIAKGLVRGEESK